MDTFFGIAWVIFLIIVFIFYAHKKTNKTLEKDETNKIFNEVIKTTMAQQHLIFAVVNGSLALAKKTIEDGAKVDIEYQDKYLLNIAISKGNFDIVKELINAGANVNKVDKNNMVPMSFAILENNLTIVKELIKSGANVNGEVFLGHSILWYAYNNLDKKNDIIKELINAGAKLNKMDNMFNNDSTDSYDSAQFADDYDPCDQGDFDIHKY